MTRHHLFGYIIVAAIAATLARADGLVPAVNTTMSGCSTGLMLFYTTKLDCVPATPKTLASLPTCDSTLKGARALITDALAPAFLVTAVGGGAITVPVFCNGTAWMPG